MRLAGTWLLAFHSSPDQTVVAFKRPNPSSEPELLRCPQWGRKRSMADAMKADIAKRFAERTLPVEVEALSAELFDDASQHVLG